MIAALCMALLTGCLGPQRPGPEASPRAAGASQASQPVATRPAPATQPVAATQPTPPVVHAPAPAAPEGSVSGTLLPRDMPPHPFLLFDKADLAGIARRKGQDPLMQECWDKMVELAGEPDQLDEWWEQLETRAFIAIAADDKAMARKAIDLMQAGLRKTDPGQFYEIGAANFLLHGAPLRALALAWDWLYGFMTPQERGSILPQMERWCGACLTSTNKRWWREASYNVGAIPIGGLGILALAIHGDSAHPDANLWLREATRRIAQNYFPTTWKPSGICYEGPNYAIVGLKYPALFAEALRRAGAQDIVGSAGATLASQYLMYQWMPEDGCAPIGDNTGYGRRTFAAEYLLGIGRSKDPVALWTWRNNLDNRYLDPLITYLWYPLGLRPAGPVAAQAPTARYFEVTPNRAGYLFSRTKWQDPDAAFFAFVTRYERCNHQHYDMNSFLLGAFGTLFATHEMLFPYGDDNHGVDFEHNMIIVDQGGWPRHDNNGSCGDDNSTEGVLTGLATGPFADYMRGDAKWSYRDNSIIIDNPAIRAERAFLFVKAGATPYMVALDDLQFSDDPHDYRWQWYAPADVSISGAGSTADPLILAAQKGSCALSFITPGTPAVTIGKIQNVARSGSRRRGSTQPAASQTSATSSRPDDTAARPARAARSRPAGAAASRAAGSRPGRYADRPRSERFLQRIDVAQKGIRVHYAAVATLQLDAADRPLVQAQPVTCESPSAAGAQVRLADGSIDRIAWQSEEVYQQRGSDLASGDLRTDGLAAMVRVKDGKVTGYILGEGTYLKWGEKVLVQAKDSVCVTADKDGVKVSGRRQSRKGLPTVEPMGVKTFRP